MRVVTVERAEYPSLLELWEDTVRATHDFLSEEDIQFFKSLILHQYLDVVELRCVRNVFGKIIGFIGVSENNIEMLFVSPKWQGRGVGKALIDYAVNDLGATKVDVNEQNKQTRGFYEHFGFAVVGRSPLDNTGKPYPILHLRLQR